MRMFAIKCICGETTEGLYFPDSTHDTLHCGCGLVWTIPRPVKEEDVTVSVEEVKQERQYGSAEGEVNVLPGYKILTICLPGERR